MATQWFPNGWEIAVDNPGDGELLISAPRGLVTDWVPVDASTQTWRARGRDEDGNQAEAIGPSNEAWRIEPAPPPGGEALAAQLGPLTRKLRTLAAPLTVRDG